MNRKQRYMLCYAALGLTRSNASVAVKRAAYRAALVDGLDQVDWMNGTRASEQATDQAALQALCNQLVDEPDQPV